MAGVVIGRSQWLYCDGWFGKKRSSISSESNRIWLAQVCSKRQRGALTNQQAWNDLNWRRKEGCTTWRLGGISAVEETNEIKRESLLNEAIAQGEEMKPFERVKHAVEALHARQVVHWRELKIRERSPREGRVMKRGFCTRRELISLETDDFSAWETQGFGKYPQFGRGRRGAAVKEDTGEAAKLGERG